MALANEAFMNALGSAGTLLRGVMQYDHGGMQQVLTFRVLKADGSLVDVTETIDASVDPIAHAGVMARNFVDQLRLAGAIPAAAVPMVDDLTPAAPVIEAPNG